MLVQPPCSEMGSELGVIQVLETYKRKIKSCQSLLSWVQAHAHLGSAGKAQEVNSLRAPPLGHPPGKDTQLYSFGVSLILHWFKPHFKAHLSIFSKRLHVLNGRRKQGALTTYIRMNRREMKSHPLLCAPTGLSTTRGSPNAGDSSKE